MNFISEWMDNGGKVIEDCGNAEEPKTIQIKLPYLYFTLNLFYFIVWTSLLLPWYEGW